MARIHVTGNAGVGKSTLAARIAVLVDAPVFGLDAIVFLDYPRRTSFWRCAKRNWRYLFRSRPGLPPRCPEIRIVPTLARIIWRFPTRVRPTLLAEFEEWKRRKTIVHIRSDAGLHEFVRRLESGGTKARSAGATATGQGAPVLIQVASGRPAGAAGPRPSR